MDVKGKVDFGIITIREDEFEAVLARFPAAGRVTGRRQYNLRQVSLPGGDSYLVAVLRCFEQGNGEAQSAAHDLLEDLSPHWLLVVGIAGGVPSEEFGLGDVIVSTRIYDFSVEAVLQESKPEYALGGGPVDKTAAALAANLPALREELGNWAAASSIIADRPAAAIPDDALLYGDESWQKRVRSSLFANTARRYPLVSAGAIASSDRLIKSTEILSVWMKMTRQVLAIEMESAGVYRATYGRQAPTLSIRGISDIVGFKRDPAWTRYACHTAASFAFALVQTRPFEPRGAHKLALIEFADKGLSQGLTAHHQIENPFKPQIKPHEELFANDDPKIPPFLSRRVEPGADAVIITALQDELDAVLALREGGKDGMWSKVRDPSGLPYHYREITNNHGELLRVAVAWSGELGESAAAVRATRLIEQLDPQCLAMCGICAGRRGEVFLGDVIVADRVYSYDHGKLIKHGYEPEAEFFHDITTYNLDSAWKMDAAYFAREFLRNPALAEERPPSREAQQRWFLHTLSTHELGGGVSPDKHPDRSSLCPAWTIVIQELKRAGLLESIVGALQLTKRGHEAVAEDRLLDPDGQMTDPAFRVHIGPIATGKAVRSDPELFDRLKRHVRKTLGVEMEAAAIGMVASQLGRKSIIVKAVSDYADVYKDDSFRQFACGASARFLLDFLREHLRPVGPAQHKMTRLAGAPTEVLGSTSRSVRPLPQYSDDRSRELSGQIAEARERKLKLQSLGASTASIDQEILGLRRQLREGGQLREGDTLRDGQYLLLRPIGRGGFATVWEAYDEQHHQRVAIKVLHAELARDPLRRDRFFRGARVMLELDHESIVRVLVPHGEDGGFYFFVMEFVPGGDFRSAILSKQIQGNAVIPLILKIGAALAHAHSKNFVHRDVKPANILLDGAGTPRLTDFDLVGGFDTTGGTRTGALGTFIYAAPELMHRPQDATARADVYGLGMTLLFGLQGQELTFDVIQDTEKKKLINRLPCSGAIKKVISRATTRTHGMRFRDAAEFCHALKQANTSSEVPGDSLSSIARPDSLPRPPPSSRDGLEYAEETIFKLKQRGKRRSERETISFRKFSESMPSPESMPSLDTYTKTASILHLSDLHFVSRQQAEDWYSQLAEDLRLELGCHQLDGAILSGDITNKSMQEGFEAALVFLGKLLNEFRFTPQQLVIVPGNHDLCRTTSESSYRLTKIKGGEKLPVEGTFVRINDKYLEVREEHEYKKRFERFSQFYANVKGEPYPLDYVEQGLLYHFPEANLLVLGLNSSWNLDHHFITRADIHSTALTRQLERLRKDEEKYRDCLKIAVWHHPLGGVGEDRIKDHGFLERLAVAGFRLVLHGHVHSARSSLYRYDWSAGGRRIEIVAAGTFGAPTHEWVPGYPLQYNLLQFRGKQLTVRTRRREELSGAWKPDARWVEGPSKDPKSFYSLNLS